MTDEYDEKNWNTVTNSGHKCIAGGMKVLQSATHTVRERQSQV